MKTILNKNGFQNESIKYPSSFMEMWFFRPSVILNVCEKINFALGRKFLFILGIMVKSFQIQN